MPTEAEERSEKPHKKLKTDKTPSKTGRRRAACQSCSLRKVKCDNIRPECSTCQATNSPCVYLSESDDSLTLERVVEILGGQIDNLSQRIDQIHSTTHSRGRSTQISLLPDRSLTGQYVETPAHLTHFPSHEDLPQPARDYSHIPPHRTTADEVLTWPIFEDKYPHNYFIDWHLGDKLFPKTFDDDATSTDDLVLPVSHNVAPLEEHRIPSLVDGFLQQVHTKNPILDVEALVRKSREHASKGLAWDGYSCLLLTACALGLVAKPFGSELEALDSNLDLDAARHISAPARERDQADHCFVQAARRLGGLRPSIITAQCYFFAGVYLMYTLRPMISWKYFMQASITYQLYLKMQGRVGDDNVVVSINDPTRMEIPSSRRARLEQRLYWSCFKSEAEFRVELPLPQSEIASYDFPNLFPSPPSPIVQDSRPMTLSEVSPTSDTPSLQTLSIPTILSQEPSDGIRLHAKKLCNEEESWYYYLTEVALRRIGNRIINTFFRQDPMEWMNIDRLIGVATEFEAQVSTWQTNLPPAMQKYETNSTIRAPRIASPGGAEASFVSRELSWATENRLLEMRHWLYQPFLYYLIHAHPDPSAFSRGPQADEALSPTEIHHAQGTFWMLIARAIDCNLTILETRSIPHRHHGLWYDLRAIICSSLILLAVVKAGYIELIPGGKEVLVGATETASTEQGRARLPRRETGTRANQKLSIGGRFGRVLRQLEIWSHESPDMVRARELLEVLIKEILQVQ